MIKRILLIFTVVVAAVSCLPPSTFTQNGYVAATFEYKNADYDKLFGKDSVYFDSETKVGLAWDLLVFYHQVNKQTSEFEGGFLLSHLTYPKSGDLDNLQYNKYRVNARNMAGVHNTYVVFEQTESMPEKDMAFVFSQNSGASGTCVMDYCYVNNTVAAAKAIEQNFVMGDKILLKAKGYLAGTPTGTAEIMLAEKTTARDSIMYSWTKFDLSALGSVDKVDFEIIAPAEKNIPATVCIDDVVASVTLMYE